VVNEIWWTPAAQRADIVLPATTSLERNDIGGSSRDRYVLAMHRAIDPLHEARADFDIFADLAERLGTREAFTEGRDEMAWIREIYGRCADAHASAGIAFPDFERFWEEGHVELPRGADDFVLFADFRADPEGHPLRTPSGRIELYSEKIASFGYPDCGPHPRWIAPDEWLGAGGAEAHPLHLVSVQPAGRLHSQLDFGIASTARKVGGRERITLNAGDARSRGLVDGETVRVFNGRGACLAGLATSDGVMPGVAVMETGAWFAPRDGAPEDAGTANVLTRDVGTSQLTQGPNAMSCLVQVARWTGAAA
jgi:biotin/methionine sulfoxide reductase